MFYVASLYVITRDSVTYSVNPASLLGLIPSSKILSCFLALRSQTCVVNCHHCPSQTSWFYRQSFCMLTIFQLCCFLLVLIISTFGFICSIVICFTYCCVHICHHFLVKLLTHLNPAVMHCRR